MSAALSLFAFQGDQLEVVTADGAVFVGIRAICDGVGIDFSTQLQKLKADPSVGVVMIPTPSAGGVQETACIPLRALPLWLATIHPGKVKAAVREKVIAYRREAAEVLADHFLGPRLPPALVSKASGKPLTKKQADVLEYLRAYSKQFGTAPSIREIGAHFGWVSTNAVNDHLDALARKGAIRRRGEGKARGIILPPEAPAPVPPVPAPANDARIDRLERLVEQLVGVLAAQARPARRWLPAPGQAELFTPKP